MFWIKILPVIVHFNHFKEKSQYLLREAEGQVEKYWSQGSGLSTWAALAWLRNLRQKLRGKWLCNGRANSCGDLTGRFIMYHDRHESYGWYYIASMNYLVLGNLSFAKTFTDVHSDRDGSLWKMDTKMQRSFIEKMLLSMFSQKLFRSDLLSCSIHMALYRTIQ